MLYLTCQNSSADALQTRIFPEHLALLMNFH